MCFKRYTCSQCGASVTKAAQTCPKCHADLTRIKCEECGFTGTQSDFINDYCPLCESEMQRESNSLMLYFGRSYNKWDKRFNEFFGKPRWVLVILNFFIALLFVIRILTGISYMGYMDFVGLPYDSMTLFFLLRGGLVAFFCWRAIRMLIRIFKYRKTHGKI